MTISRSLNFSLFQSSSSSGPKVEEEDDEEDYDWGESELDLLYHYIIY